MDDKRILDESGRPIGPEPKEVTDRQFVESIVEARLTAAVSDLRDKNQSQFQDIDREIRKRNRIWHIFYTVLTAGLGFSLVTVWNWIPGYVRDQFFEPKVTHTVDRVIQEKSEDYVNNKLQPLDTKIDATGVKLEKKLREISEITASARKTTEELKQIVEFQTLVLKVNADDRKAFNELIVIGTTENHLYRQEAINMIRQILSDPRYVSFLEPTIDWTKINLDPDKATESEFMNLVKIAQNHEKIAVFKAIWNAKQLDRRRKLTMFYQGIQTADTISTLAALCKVIADETKTNRNFLDGRWALEYLDGEMKKLDLEEKASRDGSEKREESP